MKNIIYVIACLCFSNIQAQDPQLFDNDWYLETLVVNGVNYESPNEELVGELQINNKGVTVSHSLCGGVYFIGNLLFSGTDVFTIDGQDGALIPTDCDNEIYNTYIGIHYSVYTELKNPFVYNIQEVNDYIQLTITNGNDDLAVYNNVLLGVTEVADVAFRLFPNPVQDQLFIQAQQPIVKGSVYNVNGQELWQFEEVTGGIDVSSLAQGMYFVAVETRGGKRVQPFIKAQ